MNILMVGSEAVPFVKTGGLGDVLGALPAALARLGDEVAVVLPRYRAAQVEAAERIWEDLPIWVGHSRFVVAIDQVIHHRVRYLFVDCPELYDRPGIYVEEGDNHIRFALLNQAAIAVARYIFRPDILHGHDWQAGLAAPYMRTIFAGDPTFFGTRCVLTIHNLGYQGRFPGYTLGALGLDRSMFHPEGLEFFGDVSFLKAGIVWSDAITTVSPTYAVEIQTREYGFGFDGLLRARANKITGILNGVDYNEWDPANDPHIAAPYSVKDLSGKLECKKALLDEMGLPPEMDRPVIGIISRFAEQKGFALLEDLTLKDVAMVVLGSGDRVNEEMFRSFARNWPDRFAVRVGYDEALAHRIEAGADMFLMPSRYEPCGLSQIYSLRYGTVPIVRATGGLEDTVDKDTGFKFREFSPMALEAAIQVALRAWEDRKAWTERMRLGMAKDYSWDVSAAGYQEVYRRAVTSSVLASKHRLQAS